jgi:hypothetical protein
MPYKDPVQERKYRQGYYKSHQKALSRYYKKRYKANRLSALQKKREWERTHPVARMLQKAKERAKEKGIPFSLSVLDVHVPTHCPLLGIKLKRGRGKRTDNSPSLDRIVPTEGYVKGNVWVISWRANRIKNDASLAELRRMTRALGRAVKRRKSTETSKS